LIDLIIICFISIHQYDHRSEAQVRSQTSPCGIYGGTSGTGTGSTRTLQFSPSESFHQCSIYIVPLFI